MPLLLEGLAAGAVPGLLAFGLALVHRSTGVLSFAHAGVGAVGAYAALVLGGPPALGGVVALGAGALTALPLAGWVSGEPESRGTSALLVTLGYGLLLEALLLLLFGPDPRALLHFFELESPVSVPGGSVPRTALLLLAAVLGFALPAALLTGLGPLGWRLRAVGSAPRAAALIGVRPRALRRAAWALSGGAAGLSAWLLAPRLGLEPHLLWGPLLSGFVAAALAGLNAPLRALAVGLVLGLAERLLAEGAGPEVALVGRSGLYVVVLLFAPRGRSLRS